MNQDAYAPPVHSLVVLAVALVLELRHLGCEVLCRARERLARAVAQRKPEVGELRVPHLVEQHVLGLQVAVDDRELVVQVSEAE